jgi:hypothetical protein
MFPLLETPMRAFREPFAAIVMITGAIVLYPYFATAQEDASSIVRKSAEANERDWAAVPQFENSERDRDKHGDHTYVVTMMYGSPYERLIAVNGRPLSPSQQKAEQKKYETTVAERQHESADKRAQRIAKYEADRHRDHTLLEQMIAAFDFHLMGKHVLNHHQVYVLKATPRHGYKPPDRDSEVLPGMEGTLWIDEKTFQWVKVEAHVMRPVRIEGFLAEVEPGTRFEVEKSPVAGDIWLASHFSMRSSAKVMLLFPHKGEEDDTYFDYHRAPNTSAGK